MLFVERRNRAVSSDIADLSDYAELVEMRGRITNRITNRVPPANSVVVTWSKNTHASAPTLVTPYLRTATPPRVNEKFTYIGCRPEQASNVGTANDQDAVRNFYLPQSPVGFRALDVMFDYEEDFLSIKYKRSQAGHAFEVYIDGVCVTSTCTGLTGASQAGSANTITLPATASATNGIYNDQWVWSAAGGGTVGGAGGQYRQILSYNGTTKVATIRGTWTTNPTTEDCVVSPMRTNWVDTSDAYVNAAAGQTFNYCHLDFTNEMAQREIRIRMSGMFFYGVLTPNAGAVLTPALAKGGIDCYSFGDSFEDGTGARFRYSAMGEVFADTLGLQNWNFGIGGVGYLTKAVSMNIIDRLKPPRNSWKILYSGSSGTWTLTQGSVTITGLAYNITTANLQTAIDNAFGAGNWRVCGQATIVYLLASGTNNQSDDTAMTADFSGIGTPANNNAITRYRGDLGDYIRRDVSGTPLPGILRLAAGHNDTTSQSVTPAALQAALTTCLADLVATYPMLTIIVFGVKYLPGTVPPPTNILDANNAIRAAVVAANVPLINGKVPFVDSLDTNTQWVTGTENIATTPRTFAANSSWVTFSDNIHPSDKGHRMYGKRDAAAVIELYS